MKKTFLNAGKSTLLFLLILFSADRAIGYYLEKIYFKLQNGEFYQTIHALTKAKEDILIFGSSRAMHHYKSHIIEEHFQVPTYNLGRSGKNILYSYAVFSQLLSTYKPKVVILDVQPSEFSWKAGREGEDAMIDALLPFKDFPEINKNISKIRKSEILLSNLFKTYPYNTDVAEILGYHYGFINDESNNGYIALKGNKISKKVKRIEKSEQVSNDPELIRVFRGFISLAKANKVELYVVISPTTRRLNAGSIHLIKKITQEAKIPLFNYSELPEFNDYTLFYDGTHLNDQGATEFTNEIVNKLSHLKLFSEKFSAKPISDSLGVKL
ncbi:DUF1574 domain-containing protein [Desertivirga xinjiangensis]|uniref:DUF1574 domain-containing protein n=1 Tax=Desertivirga xinjiangensis TaxID=539206 RepID=UPI00210C6C8F|nr:DUF1574 domain-containing protein [Pedobacter xinjiangensis]